jgi:hypothetical protein
MLAKFVSVDTATRMGIRQNRLDAMDIIVKQVLTYTNVL